MASECPSCGNIVENGQAFCPMCGTQIKDTKKTAKKAVNKELESLLFTVNANAETALAEKLGAGLIGQDRYAKLVKLETAYLEIIQNFPTEPKAYLAYVDYVIKFVLKIHNLQNVFATTQYFIGDVDLIVKRCKDYLLKAKEFADDDELEKILQLESELSSKIEALANDGSIKQKQEKNKKIAKWCLIFGGILMAFGLICWLFG